MKQMVGWLVCLFVSSCFSQWLNYFLGPTAIFENCLFFSVLNRQEEPIFDFFFFSE